MASGQENKPTRTWREFISDTTSLLVFVGFLLTLPVSFPLLILYKKVRGEKIRGKGVGAFFLLWVAMTAILAVVVAVYVQKGFEGFRTLFWIAVVGSLWAVIVFSAIRLLLEFFVWVVKLVHWLEKRFKK